MNTETQPKIEFQGENYFEIGCENCNQANWRLFFNGETFVIQCRNCLNTKHVQRENVKQLKVKTFDRRFF